MAGKKRQEEIGQELKQAATWVSGPRKARLLALSEELLGEEQPDDATTKPTEKSAEKT